MFIIRTDTCRVTLLCKLQVSLLRNELLRGLSTSVSIDKRESDQFSTVVGREVREIEIIDG